MVAKEMATPRHESMSFSRRLRHGPWPEAVIRRLESAIEALAQECRSEDAVAALILFGSYSRGEYGRKSDVDLLLLLDVPGAPESSGIAQQRLRSIGRLESAWQLPMHLSPLLVSVGRVQELGADLLHAFGRDGMVLHWQASALALLQPDDLMPWTVVTFSLAQLTPGRRAAASRRLHGGVGRRAVVAPPSLFLGPGAMLIPASAEQAAREALDEAGATYETTSVWRSPP